MDCAIERATGHEAAGAPPRAIAGQGTDEAAWNRSPIGRLPVEDVAAWTRRFRRIWLLAPHPDDEVLALGGTLVALAAAGASPSIVSVTDGEASHEGSTAWSRATLAAVRPTELRCSLDALGVDAPVVRIGLPDGGVDAQRRRLLQALVERIDRRDLLLATWRRDGHPDHEACGDVAAVAAERTGATLFEYPVWMWHWASPDEASIPWKRARQIPLDPETMARKRDAIGRFASQLQRDGPREAVLPPYVLPRFMRPFEIVFV